MANIKVIVFDLDGVILDTIDWIRQAFKHTLKRFGLRFKEDIFIKTSGESLEDVYRTMTSKRYVKRFVEEHLRWQLQNIKKVRPFPDVKKTLELLRRYRIALWTGRKSRVAEKQLEMAELKDFFIIRVYREDTKTSKPNPEGLLKIMRKFKAKPKEVVYVGDSLMDIKAGKSAGVLTVGALYGVSKKKIKGKADYEIKKFSDILKVIKKLEEPG